jgi:hypothetical protein
VFYIVTNLRFHDVSVLNVDSALGFWRRVDVGSVVEISTLGVRLTRHTVKSGETRLRPKSRINTSDYDITRSF